MKISLIISIFVALVLGIGFGYYHYSDFYAKRNIDSVVVDIEKGATYNDVGDILAKNKVIDNPIAFNYLARIIFFGKTFKAGEYEFGGELSPFEIALKIIKHQVIQYNITIPEGFTAKQIVEILYKLPKLQGEIDKIPDEGSLFPDTWVYIKGDSRMTLLTLMQKKMDKELDKIWQNKGDINPIKSKVELLILASLIEKETGIASERPIVSGVFYNRLRMNMKLQSDPTTIYPLSNFTGDLNRYLTKKDLESINEWNTYTREGLPKTPICNPSLAAIQAAADPATHKYLFFVANGNRGHSFAETYAQHKRNVEAYRLLN